MYATCATATRTVKYNQIYFKFNLIAPTKIFPDKSNMYN